MFNQFSPFFFQFSTKISISWRAGAGSHLLNPEATERRRRRASCTSGHATSFPSVASSTIRRDTGSGCRCVDRITGTTIHVLCISRCCIRAMLPVRPWPPFWRRKPSHARWILFQPVHRRAQLVHVRTTSPTKWRVKFEHVLTHAFLPYDDDSRGT
jgi:hypothetical protein